MLGTPPLTIDLGDGGEDNSVAPVKSIESYREVIEEGDSAR